MDEILEVNHVTVRGISHHDASAILRNTPKHVHLALGKTKEGANYSKRRSTASRGSTISLERAHSPSSDHYASSLSLNKLVPSSFAVDLNMPQADIPVPEVTTQEQPTVVKLIKVLNYL